MEDDQRQTILLADYVRQALYVVSQRDMGLVHQIDLPYTPRAIAIDPERDLLMLTEWFGGWVQWLPAARACFRPWGTSSSPIRRT